jgi:hypothetical protein
MPGPVQGEMLRAALKRLFEESGDRNTPSLLSLDELRRRTEPLRRQQSAVQAELEALNTSAEDQQRYLRLVDNLVQFGARLRPPAETMEMMTDSHQCFEPIPTLVGELNRHLKGWANYFSVGYPSGVYWEIDWYMRGRLIQHLQRRSQRPFRPPKGVSWYST